jgi:hypothetical protein
MPHFDFSTSIGCARNLITEAVVCSAKMNFALRVSSRQGFVPLAEAAPYGDLLRTKYARAIRKLESAKNHIPITDLSFALFDELVPVKHLEAMTFSEVVDYRKASEGAREQFLEYLGSIQAKQADLESDSDYAVTINKIVKAEILPAAHNFRNKLQTITESLYGALASGALAGVAGSAGLSFFGDVPWEKLLLLAGAYVGKVAIDGILATRTAKRECSISYVLSLDK